MWAVTAPQVVVHHVAGADHLDSTFVEAALGKLLHEVATLTAGNEHVERVGLCILDALKEGREIGIDQGNLDFLDDFPSAVEKALLEKLKSVIARRVICRQRRYFTDSVPCRPIPNDDG